MDPDTGLNLTAIDKVLLHLKDHWHHRNDKVLPPTITQRGISEATGLRLTHVPRTMKSLEERELVKSGKSHVKGEKRRYKIYLLTEKGLAEANSLLAHLKEQVVDGMKVEKILASEKGAILPALRKLAGEDNIPGAARCALFGPVPSIEGFVDRENEMAALAHMLDDDKARVMVIYGSRGYGKSALAAKLLDEACQRWTCAWLEMKKGFPEFKKAVVGTLGELIPDIDLDLEHPEKLAAMLDGSKMILVLDNYFDATDDLVEFLTGFIAAIKRISGFKLLVTARESVPSYNRFYTILDIHDGTVGEVHIRGLDIEHCREILGTPDIDPEAMKRLYMFTMGKPPTLRLLARGDVRVMKEKTRFTPEEIKLMLFLKEQKCSEPD